MTNQDSKEEKELIVWVVMHQRPRDIMVGIYLTEALAEEHDSMLGTEECSICYFSIISYYIFFCFNQMTLFSLKCRSWS